MKSSIFFCLKMFFILVGSALIGMVLLNFAYLIPTGELSQDNMRFSAEKIDVEGAYPTVMEGISSKLDNYTDSLMLLKASYSGEESSLIEATMNRSNGIKKYSPQEVLVEHYKNNEPFNTIDEYSRYWHGYLIFLRPLITLFSYKRIRIINFVVQLSIVAAFVILLIRKKKSFLIIPFLVLYGFLMPLAIAKSMQFSSCFYITMLGLFWLVLNKKEDIKQICIIFMMLGILVAFFDLLTYPFITFGVPIAVYYLIKKESKIKENILDFLKIGVSWAIGYVGMWVSKWTIGSIITGKNLFSDAINQLLFRTSEISEGYSRLDVVAKNYECFFATPMNMILIVFISILITLSVVYLRNQKRKIKVKKLALSLLPFIIIMISPSIWFLVTSNHSYHHYWFTNRICAITIFGLMCGLVNLIRLLKHTSSIK